MSGTSHVLLKSHNCICTHLYIISRQTERQTDRSPLDKYQPFELIGTFDLVFILLWPVQVHGGCVSVQRVDRVGVGEQLRQERLKDVGEVWWTWERDESVQRAAKPRKPFQREKESSGGSTSESFHPLNLHTGWNLSLGIKCFFKFFASLQHV